MLLAGQGRAVSEISGALVGRDLATGEERWRLRVSGKPDVDRVGDLLLIHGADGTLRAVDYASGRARWRIPGAGNGPPVVRGADVFAYQRCAGACAVEVHAVASGERRWSAVVPGATGDGYLGAPHTDAPWAADIVLLRPSLEDYEVRDIATGKVLQRWAARGEATAVTGTTIVRSRADGTTRGIDARSGHELWRRGGQHPSLARDSQGKTLALPLLFSSTERDFPTYFDPEVVRTVDAVTGHRDGRPEAHRR